MKMKDSREGRAAEEVSRRARVPVMLVSMKACFGCEATWGLCRVAAWIMCLMEGWEAKRAARAARSVIERVRVVVEEGRMSMPRGVWPWEGRESIRAAPRWPEEPVTRMSYSGEDIAAIG